MQQCGIRFLTSSDRVLFARMSFMFRKTVFACAIRLIISPVHRQTDVIRDQMSFIVTEVPRHYRDRSTILH